MAQSVVINNVTYSDVPSVSIPKSGGGTANFYDITGVTLNDAGKLPSGIKAMGTGGTIYTGTASQNDSSDITASGDTVSVPAGFYASSATKSVASGSATAPSTISGTSATVSTGTNTLTLTKSVSVTPVVSAGYVSSGTAASSSVSLTASVTTKAAATITPGTSDQTISSDTYLTGVQTIKGDSDLVPANIKAGVTIFNVTGALSSVAVSQDQVTKVLSIS